MFTTTANLLLFLNADLPFYNERKRRPTHPPSLAAIWSPNIVPKLSLHITEEE